MGWTAIRRPKLIGPTLKALEAYARTHAGECTIVVDELKRYMPATSCGYWQTCDPEVRTTLERIVQEGGNFGLSLVWNDQRPANVSPTALSESTAWACGLLRHHRDKHLAQAWGPGYTEERFRFLAELPDGRQHIVRTERGD